MLIGAKKRTRDLIKSKKVSNCNFNPWQRAIGVENKDEVCGDIWQMLALTGDNWVLSAMENDDVWFRISNIISNQNRVQQCRCSVSGGFKR